MSALSSTIFKDIFFDSSNWESQLCLDDVGCGSPDPNARMLCDQVPAGGSSGVFRQTIHQWGNPRNKQRVSTLVRHLNKHATFLPATHGVIHSINFSCNLMAVDPESQTHYYLLLLQNNTMYLSSRSFVANNASWTNLNMNTLTRTDFRKLDSTIYTEDHPDFSLRAAAITFGYATVCSTSLPQDEAISGIDSWRVTIFHDNNETLHRLSELQRTMETLTHELAVEKGTRSYVELELKKEKAKHERVLSLLQRKEVELAEEKIKYNQRVMEAMEEQHLKEQQTMSETVKRIEKKAMAGLEELHEELKRRDKMICSQNAQITALENELETLQGNIADAEELRVMNIKLEQELQIEREKVGALDKEVTRARAQTHSEMQHLFSSMESELNIERSVRKEMEKEYKDKLLLHSQEVQSELQLRLKTQDEMVRLETDNGQLKSKVISLEKENKAKDDEMAALKAELDEVRTQAVTYMKKLIELKHKEEEEDWEVVKSVSL